MSDPIVALVTLTEPAASTADLRLSGYAPPPVKVGDVRQANIGGLLVSVRVTEIRTAPSGNPIVDTEGRQLVDFSRVEPRDLEILLGSDTNLVPTRDLIDAPSGNQWKLDGRFAFVGTAPFDVTTEDTLLVREPHGGAFLTKPSRAASKGEHVELMVQMPPVRSPGPGWYRS